MMTKRIGHLLTVGLLIASSFGVLIAATSTNADAARLGAALCTEDGEHAYEAIVWFNTPVIDDMEDTDCQTDSDDNSGDDGGDDGEDGGD